VQEGWGRQYTIFRGRVCQRVSILLSDFRDLVIIPRYLPHYLSNLDAASLVEQQHPPGTLLLEAQLLLRGRDKEVGGTRFSAARVGDLGKGISPGREKHSFVGTSGDG
jgi:hypothetical protein